MEVVRVTIKNAAQYAEVSVITIRRWIKRGWVKADKHPLTRKWDIELLTIDALQREGPPDEPYTNK